MPFLIKYFVVIVAKGVVAIGAKYWQNTTANAVEIAVIIIFAGPCFTHPHIFASIKNS